MRPQYIGFCPPSQAHKEGLPKIFCALEMETIIDRTLKTPNNRALGWDFFPSSVQVLGGALVLFLK